MAVGRTDFDAEGVQVINGVGRCGEAARVLDGAQHGPELLAVLHLYALHLADQLADLGHLQ